MLLYSIDPAHSVSDAFARPVGPKQVEIEANLFAMEINPEQQLEALRTTYREEVGEFLDSMLSSDWVDASVDREAMEHLVDLSPPGLDEVMALADLVTMVDGGAFDRFVIDTAPSGGMLRFREAPDLVRG